MNNNQNISISTGTIFRVIFIVGLFAILYTLRDMVLVLLTAVVIASAIEPSTLWMVKRKIPRVLSVLFIYVVLSLLIFGILYVLVPTLIDEISALLTTLPQYLERPISGGQIVSGITENFSLREIITNAQGALSSLSGNFIQTLSVIFGGILSFILIIVFSFYLAVQERGIEKFLEIITPVKHSKYIIGLWKRSQEKIALWFQGQLLLGMIVGILVYLGLVILGVKSALLLAFLAAIFELIPLFGAILAAIPAVTIGFIDSITLGFMVMGLYIIIQQFENHLIYPLVVQKVVGVSPIIVIIALIIGAKLGGFLGLVLAVPMSAVFMEFIDDIQKGKREELKKINT